MTPNAGGLAAGKLEQLSTNYDQHGSDYEHEFRMFIEDTRDDTYIRVKVESLDFIDKIVVSPFRPALKKSSNRSCGNLALIHLQTRPPNLRSDFRMTARPNLKLCSVDDS